MADLVKDENNEGVSILERDLSEADEKILRENLNNWKNEVMETLMTEAEEEKEKKLEELEEANVEYKEKLKEEYSSKLLAALKDMRDELRAEAVAEMYDNNPELSILEQIKEIVAPTLNEDYIGNVYTEELQTLRERIEELEEEKSLEEGAKKLAELISPYSERTQKILISLIKEGGPDEITEQFYNLIENLEEEEDDEDEDEDDEDEEDEDDDESDEEDDEDESDEEDDEDDDEEEVDTEEDTDEDSDDTYIKEDEEGKEEKKESKTNAFLDVIKKRVSL